MIIARSGERLLDKIDADTARILIPSENFIGPVKRLIVIAARGYWTPVKPYDLGWPEEGYQEGGPGSGFFGHAGRPGEVGGSAPAGSADASEREDKRKEFDSAKIELSKDEKFALGNWLGADYKHIRKILLEGEIDKGFLKTFSLSPSRLEAGFKKMAQNLIGLFRKYKSTDTLDKPLYRGISLSQDEVQTMLDWLKPGDKYFPDKTLSSWSLLEGAAEVFSSGVDKSRVPTMLVIEGGRKNSREIRLGRYGHEGESEVLMLPKRYTFKKSYWGKTPRFKIKTLYLVFGEA